MHVYLAMHDTQQVRIVLLTMLCYPVWILNIVLTHKIQPFITGTRQNSVWIFLQDLYWTLKSLTHFPICGIYTLSCSEVRTWAHPAGTGSRTSSSALWLPPLLSDSPLIRPADWRLLYLNSEWNYSTPWIQSQMNLLKGIDCLIVRSSDESWLSDFI